MHVWYLCAAIGRHVSSLLFPGSKPKKRFVFVIHIHIWSKTQANIELLSRISNKFSVPLSDCPFATIRRIHLYCFEELPAGLYVASTRGKEPHGSRERNSYNRRMNLLSTSRLNHATNVRNCFFSFYTASIYREPVIKNHQSG